jgi:hypothetical protein
MAGIRLRDTFTFQLPQYASFSFLINLRKCCSRIRRKATCFGPNSVAVPLIQSQSHIRTDGQSVSMSTYRPHSGACDQILLYVQRLLSESCCIVSVGRSL